MNSEGPLVSVVIPTYNRAGIICQTIDNVFQQTYSNFEVIVVDDGSTDDTQSMLRQYGDRIRVITGANAGPAVARNRGAAAACGEIIAFQDSDDLWRPSKLERQVALLEKSGSSVPCCLCNAVMRTVNGKEFTWFDYSLIRFRQEHGLWLNAAEVLATRFVLFTQAAAIRKQAFEKVGGFDESLKYLEDYDLPLRLALEGGPWGFIREPLVIYREGSPESFSNAALRDFLTLKQCEVKIYERLRGLGGRGFRRKVKYRKGMAQREILATRLRKSGRFGAKTLGSLVMRLDHYWFAALRRSPWFPQPRTLPVEIAPRGSCISADSCKISGSNEIPAHSRSGQRYEGDRMSDSYIGTFLRKAHSLSGLADFYANSNSERIGRTPEEIIEFAYNYPIKPRQIRSEILRLARLVYDRRPKTLVEIGTHAGGTFFVLSRCADPGATVVSIDLPGARFSGGYPKFIKFILPRMPFETQTFRCLRADSHQEQSVAWLRSVLKENRIDVLFIDADHSFFGVNQDFQMYSPLVRNGGIVAFHDIVKHINDPACEVDRFWSEVKKNHRYEEFVEDHHQGWAGIGVLYL